jgi:hypothetical protein
MGVLCYSFSIRRDRSASGDGSWAQVWSRASLREFRAIRDTQSSQGLHCFSMLHGCDNLLITAGTAVATLIGLLFVVIEDRTRQRRLLEAYTHTFRWHVIPSFLSLAVPAPWPSARSIGLILGLGGLAGLADQIKAVIHVPQGRAAFARLVRLASYAGGEIVRAPMLSQARLCPCPAPVSTVLGTSGCGSSRTGTTRSQAMTQAPRGESPLDEKATCPDRFTGGQQ